MNEWPILILDDPGYKEEEAKKYWDAILRAQTEGNLLIIQARIHEADLPGVILE